MELDKGDLYLGGLVDPESGDRSGSPLVLPARDLTTHGVITGMTGSGKTGLGVILLEEALLSGIPVLVLDPKGDMGNLLFTFPELRPEDFEPWLDPAEAEREGITIEELAGRTAARWKSGLEGWGIGRDRIARLRASADFTIYTPGSSAGAGLNLVGSLSAPVLDWEAHAEVMQDEIEGFVSSLLAMTGRTANPIADPEHIFLSNVIEHEWRGGRDLDLARLIGLIQTPPIRKLGVFALDDFLPPNQRMELAMRLNGLMASSSFGGWMRGAPLEMDSLLRGPEGQPTASILHLAHLSDAERQFVVTLVLTKLITWMRRQPGTSDLRLLVYIDEMFGFAPPTAEPPSKKPLLTLFKQARAHGIGLVVATQNPVDLDYKMMSNAGTWIVGRLQTERDKLRVLEGLASAAGGVDTSVYSGLIGGLRKRDFVFMSTRSSDPRVFTTRWAMSFLRGPLTRQEVARLNGPPEERTEGVTPTVAAPTSPSREAPPASDESPVAPTPPGSVPVYYLDAAAPWADRVGMAPESRRLEAAIVARVEMTFDDRRAELDHREEWEAVFFPLTERFDAGSGIALDYDERDFRSNPPPNALYALPVAPIAEASYFRGIAAEIKDELYRERKYEIFRNVEFKLYSRADESEADFRSRCDRAAEDWADAEAAKLRDRYASKIARVKDVLATAERRVRELEVDVSARKQQELLSGAGKLLSVFLGGKASAGSLGGFASRRSMTVRTHERLKTAAERAESKEAEIEELEEELANALTAILDEAETKARGVEPLEVRLAKTDLVVREVALVWIPRTR